MAKPWEELGGGSHVQRGEAQEVDWGLRQGLLDGFVLLSDCRVQRGEGLLNKTLLVLTCGLFYSIPGKRKAGEETPAVRRAPGLSRSRRHPMVKVLGEPWWDHGWGRWKQLKRSQQISAQRPSVLTVSPPRLAGKASVPCGSCGREATWSCLWGGLKPTRLPGVQEEGPCSPNISSQPPPPPPGIFTLGFDCPSPAHSRGHLKIAGKNILKIHIFFLF